MLNRLTLMTCYRLIGEIRLVPLMCEMCGASPESTLHLFSHCFGTVSLWNSLVGILVNIGCPTSLDQFSMMTFMALVQVKRPSLSANVQPLLLFGTFVLNVTFVFLRRFQWHNVIWNKNRCLASI